MFARNTLLAAILLATACSHVPPTQSVTGAMAAGGRIEGLLASRAADDYAEDLDMFGRFVGDWNIRSEWYGTDGSTRRGHGGVHIGWILYGTALQDVWEGSLDDAAGATWFTDQQIWATRRN